MRILITIISLLLLSPPTLSAQGQSLKVGMIAPLTGDWAAYGKHMQRGLELAIEELRTQNIDVTAVYEDACLPAQAVSSTKKLVAYDRIQALVGSYCVIGMEAIVPYIRQQHLVSFHTSPVTAKMLADSEYIYTTNVHISDEAARLARYAFEELQVRKAGILYLETQWGAEFERAFRTQFRSRGGLLSGIEPMAIGDNDFRAQATRLLATSPEAIFIANVGLPLANAFIQLRRLGFKGQLLTVDEAEEQSVLDLAGSNAEGALLLTPEDIEPSPEADKFRKSFKGKFGILPHPLSRHIYDAALLSVRALHECAHDKQCAINKLKNTVAYPGASGTFTINTDRSTTRRYTLKKVRSGEFISEKSL